MDAVVKAIKAVFPEGTGSQKTAKEVFQSEVVHEVDEDVDNMRALCASGFCYRDSREGWRRRRNPSTTYESYTDIRKKDSGAKKGKRLFSSDLVLRVVIRVPHLL